MSLRQHLEFHFQVSLSFIQSHVFALSHYTVGIFQTPFCLFQVHRKWWAKREPLECHLFYYCLSFDFSLKYLLFWSPVRFIIRKCSSCKCFEVRKSLYDHQHDARRSDHIFNLAQLKDASEEDKTDSGEQHPLPYVC